MASLGEGKIIAFFRIYYFKKDFECFIWGERGVLTRIYFNDATYATPKNIHIGSTEKPALTAYGKAIKVEIHKYNQNGHYLKRLGRNGIVLRFETNGKLIISLSIETISAIEYAEGCL